MKSGGHGANVAAEAGASAGDGRLFLDMSDIYMYHKPTGIYSRPEKKGHFPEEESAQGTVSEYYAYPITDWFPGDALKNKPAAQQVVQVE